MSDLRSALARIPALSLPPDLWTFLEEAWEENPEEVTRMVERALNAQKPSGYFIRSAKNAREGGLGVPGGAALSEKEKRRRKLANLAANLRRAEVWGDEYLSPEEEWAEYVRSQGEELGLAVRDVEEIVRAARQGHDLAERTLIPEVGEDGLTDAARRNREYVIKRGADASRLWNGPTTYELELYTRLRPHPEPAKEPVV